MKLTRRAFLDRLKDVVPAVFGFGVSIEAVHFLLGRKTTGALYPSAIRPYQQRDVPRVIRPPGAVEERDFLAGCIRCYRCQDVCDTGAIRFYTEEHGKYLHTPYVDPSVAACDLCMRCTQVCPTGVLQPLRRSARAKVQMASVAFEKDLCLSYKTKQIRYAQGLLSELGRSYKEVQAEAERRGICGECYMFCPLRGRAIKYEPGAFLVPIVFPDECVGCGLCEEICRVMVRGEPAIRVVPTREMV